MPVAHVKDDKFVVDTERGDLGYGRGKSGSWWALKAFSAMCDDQIELSHRHTM